MGKLKKLMMVAALVLPAASQAEPRLGYLTIGPMLHWNFSANRFNEFSVGLEAAWWTYQKAEEDEVFFYNMPDIAKGGYGAALGLEASNKAIRAYLEPQVGWVYAGLSLGPVYQWSKEKDATGLGIQGSGWLNAMGGFDFRYRYLEGQHNQALGLYAKVGKLVSGGSQRSEE